MNNQTVFLLSFSCGLLFYRMLFLITPRYFRHPIIRTRLGIRWHHWHMGMLLILAGAVMLTVTGNAAATLGFLGVGLGLTLDEFIPFFYIKTERENELREYRRSLLPTLMLGAGVIVAVLLVSLLHR